jgi:uncharacterized membrane protein
MGRLRRHARLYRVWTRQPVDSHAYLPRGLDPPPARSRDPHGRYPDQASLQNGTAFFASTSLFAVGGGLALLRSTNDALAVLGALPINLSPSPALWEIKCVGLVLIFIYAFFKFAWAYRLFNYVAILIGAMPAASQRDTPEAEAHVQRMTRLFETAGRHFNRGQRAFFFALGYLGWFVSPWVLFATTAAVVIVIWRRQFASDAWSAMGS